MKTVNQAFKGYTFNYRWIFVKLTCSGVHFLNISIILYLKNNFVLAVQPVLVKSQQKNCQRQPVNPTAGKPVPSVLEEKQQLNQVPAEACNTVKAADQNLFKKPFEVANAERPTQATKTFDQKSSEVSDNKTSDSAQGSNGEK
jgi:hypothetical protein